MCYRINFLWIIYFLSIQHNSLNARLSNSQLKKLKSAIKNKTEVVLRLSSNMIGNSDDETNFPHKLLLTNRQVANLRKVIPNNLSTDINFGPLSKTGLPLMKNVIKPFANCILIPLGLPAALSAADAGMHKKVLGSWTTTLTISNNEMKDIIKLAKSLEDSGLSLKGVSKTI